VFRFAKAVALHLALLAAALALASIASMSRAPWPLNV
jgi:hypothetical protein